jgi:hypothetical protein
MTDLEIKVLKEVYGLEHIQDLDELRAAMREKDSQMNALDQVEIRMRIGRKMEEAMRAVPGSLYTPANGSLLLTAAVLFVFSLGAGFFAVKTHVWLIFRVLVGIIGFVFFAASCRAVWRIIYRSLKHRDF